MPKFPSIPRVSIVVPIGNDLVRFERTLISVLENQPAGCEVIVAHGGNYTDPFDLCGEVQFVTGDSNSLVDLVAAGAMQSRGRFVHVISSGVQATRGWLDNGLEKFEHSDAGCVAPVIRHTTSSSIVAAGWCDEKHRLCKSVCQGDDSTGAAPKLIGAYLQASFWRRELLRSLGSACKSRDTLTATYAYEHLMRAAGWRCVLANECELHYDDLTLHWDQASFARGKQLRAVRSCFSRRRASASRSISAASTALLANLLRPSCWMESLGQAASTELSGQLATQIRVDAVASCHDISGDVLSIRSRQSSRPARRAA